MHITIWVTDNCNLSCKYCYEGSDKKVLIMSSEIEAKAIKMIFDQLKEKKVSRLSITLHGGEPLLAFDRIKSIVGQIKQGFPDCEFGMTTNGTILNDEILEFITREIKDLSVSIDGTRENHDKNRVFQNGIGTYEQIHKNIKRILKLKSNVRARMTVTPASVNQLNTNVEHLILLGLKVIEPNLDFTDSTWEEEHIKIYNRELKKIADMIGHYKSVEVPILNNAAYKSINSPCGGGYTSWNISATGDIYPCILAVYHPELIIGNVFDGIKKEKAEFIKELAQKENKDCVGCSRYNYCRNTRCKLINYLQTGDYNKPSPIMCAFENSAVMIAKYYNKIQKKKMESLII